MANTSYTNTSIEMAPYTSDALYKIRTYRYAGEVYSERWTFQNFDFTGYTFKARAQACDFNETTQQLYLGTTYKDIPVSTDGPRTFVVNYPKNLSSLTRPDKYEYYLIQISMSNADNTFTKTLPLILMRYQGSINNI